MTIENGTGQTLHVHFSGPMNRTVVVPNGRSESVELAVGDYQVAAEVPGARIIPFYGRQAYKPFTHYWLRFYSMPIEPSAKSSSQLPLASRQSTAQSLQPGQVWKFDHKGAEGRLSILALYDEKPHGRIVTALVYVPSCEYMGVGRFSEAAIKSSVTEYMSSDFNIERQRNVVEDLKSKGSMIHTVSAAQFVKDLSGGRCQ
jgi:hypothetical protein